MVRLLNILLKQMATWLSLVFLIPLVCLSLRSVIVSAHDTSSSEQVR